MNIICFQSKVLPDMDGLDGTIRGYTYRVGQRASMTSGVGTWNPPSSPPIKRANSMVR